MLPVPLPSSPLSLIPQAAAADWVRMWQHPRAGAVTAADAAPEVAPAPAASPSASATLPAARAMRRDHRAFMTLPPCRRAVGCLDHEACQQPASQIPDLRMLQATGPPTRE